MTTSNPPRKSPLGIKVIGIFKLISSVLLVGLGYGIFRQIGGDPEKQIERIVGALKLDADNRYIHTLMEAISGVSQRQLYLASAGTFVYAILYAIEGTGLVLQRRWGEYVTIFITGSLIPFETWEVIRRLTPIRSFVLALNVGIVVYLVLQLRRSIRLDTEIKVEPTPVSPLN